MKTSLIWRKNLQTTSRRGTVLLTEFITMIHDNQALSVEHKGEKILRCACEKNQVTYRGTPVIQSNSQLTFQRKHHSRVIHSRF